ncbi:uncharacterized protein LOC141907309 isoform X2 [Tubulanus polymorphus]|uniref:uncharacterized protein LOC141907309 isoform X2 n=1 Tax=Tubulanus polymorphus TaxID=672921 RepID=UPI003DA402D1
MFDDMALLGIVWWLLCVNQIIADKCPPDRPDVGYSVKKFHYPINESIAREIIRNRKIDNCFRKCIELFTQDNGKCRAISYTGDQSGIGSTCFMLQTTFKAQPEVFRNQQEVRYIAPFCFKKKKPVVGCPSERPDVLFRTVGNIIPRYHRDVLKIYTDVKLDDCLGICLANFKKITKSDCRAIVYIKQQRKCFVMKTNIQISPESFQQNLVVGIYIEPYCARKDSVVFGVPDKPTTATGSEEGFSMFLARCDILYISIFG